MKHLLKVVLFAAVIATGCTTGTVQMARTNGEGNFQLGVEPGVGRYAVQDEGALTLPTLNLSGRYGISDRVDLGVRIGYVVYELQAKFMLTNPYANSPVTVSLAPSVFAFGGASAGSAGIIVVPRIPLLTGIRLGKHELVVGARLLPVFGIGASEGEQTSEFTLLAGGELGFAWRLGRKFWLMPHAKVDAPIVGSGFATGETGVVTGFSGVSVGGGIGLLFGGPD